MNKFKVGDRVRCIKGPARHHEPSPRGAGWKYGLEFIVGSVTKCKNPGNDIYWPAPKGSGVYEDELELAYDRNSLKGVVEGEIHKLGEF